jgi:hypothetical protein
MDVIYLLLLDDTASATTFMLLCVADPVCHVVCVCIPCCLSNTKEGNNISDIDKWATGLQFQFIHKLFFLYLVLNDITYYTHPADMEKGVVDSSVRQHKCRLEHNYG